MKKIIAIIAVLIIIAAGILLAKSQFSPTDDGKEQATTSALSDLLLIQYRVYAPESASVFLDGEAVSYNESIDCFSAEVKKEGRYTLTIEQTGCEAINEKVFISKENNEYTPSLVYTQSYISQAHEEGKRLLEALMQRCWSLDYDLSDFNFISEDEQLACEEKLADYISALSENLSAEYTTGELKLTLTSEDSTSPSAAPDNEGSSVFVRINGEYSYPWQFISASYSNSGTAVRNITAYIIIENSKGLWCIRDFNFSINNEIM